MIVYLGSTEIIKNPDVVHSKKYLDFGRGFYITTFENQAKKWAVRKGMRQKKTAIVNVYELSEEWSGFRVLSFEKENEKWLDFVCACRKGQSLNKEYDIIIGNVADDDLQGDDGHLFHGGLPVAELLHIVGRHALLLQAAHQVVGHAVVDGPLAGDGALLQAVEGGGVVLVGHDHNIGVAGGEDLLGLALVELLQFLVRHIKTPPFGFYDPLLPPRRPCRP